MCVYIYILDGGAEGILIFGFRDIGFRVRGYWQHQEWKIKRKANGRLLWKDGNSAYIGIMGMSFVKSEVGSQGYSWLL